MPPMDDDEDPNNGKLYESDSEDDGKPGSRAEPERPNDKGYLKCEACDHWLPWLWDKKNSLCARCSGNRELRAWFDRELA